MLSSNQTLPSGEAPLKRSITILYGSETGNAQDYAQILAKRLRHQRFETVVCTMGAYDVRELLHTLLLVVVCSTTGQGELPRNAKPFLRFLLKKKLPADLLSHVAFTTFGLGDSSYAQFNYAIKKIHNRLLQVGAVEFSPRAESDEQAPEGTDGYYSEWEAELLRNLAERCPLPEGVLPLSEEALLPPVNRVVVERPSLESEMATLCVNDPKVMPSSTDFPITASPKLEALTRTTTETLFVGEVTANERVTSADHFQDVRRVVLTDSSQSLAYSPGDTVGLYPTNDAAAVELLLENQGWTEIADCPVRIENETHIEGGLVARLTLRTLLTHHMDLLSVPRRSFFSLVWHFTADERERERLREFSSIDHADELFDYANRPRRSILETILEFGTLQIPVEYLFDLVPTIKLRQFSIASAPDPGAVELVVALVEYKTVLRRARKGVCSSWLRTLSVGDRVVFSIHRSRLSFGAGTQPVVMVAPGTGVAPMKSLVGAKRHSGQPMTLFYGCRFEQKDYLFREYWQTLCATGSLVLHACFSRENGGYVQNALYKHRVEVGRQLLREEGILFVCGSNGSMPREVRLTVQAILEQEGGMSEGAAREYMLEMDSLGRYIQETW